MRELGQLIPFRAAPCAQDPAGVERLALSENPFGCSPLAAEAARREIDRAHLYPDSDVGVLRQEIADFYGLDGSQVLVGNGADEMLLLATLASADRGDLGVTTERTFTGYAAGLEIAGCEVVLTPLGGGGIDAERLDAVLPGAAVAVIGNPHNPLGSALTQEQVGRLCTSAARSGTVLVFDETYAEFADESAFGSALPSVRRGARTVVVRSFSKAYGLAGLRCGYALGSAQIIAAMSAIRTALPFNVNRVAIAAARAALRDQRHLRETVAAVLLTRERLRLRLSRLGVDSLPSQTSFVLARFGRLAEEVQTRLAEDHAISVRDAGPLGHPGHLRIGVCRPERLEGLLAAVQEAVGAAGQAVERQAAVR